MAFRNAVKAALLLDPEQPRPRSDDASPIAETPASAAKPRAAGDAGPAAAWHRRAEQLCAMAEALPSKPSRALISKIAALYDELARDAGWREEAAAAPPAADSRREEPPQAEDAAPARAAPPERGAFPRRPLPSARAVPRRRA